MASSPRLVALITAGSAGVGAATARLFAQSGMRVVVNYSRDTGRAEALVTELRSLRPDSAGTDGDFCAIRADLAVRDDIARLVDEAVIAMGQLDVVFSNGGWTRIRRVHDLDDNLVEDDWDRCFNMNVKSHLWLMCAAKPHLERTEGVFITNASVAGVSVSGSSMVCTYMCVCTYG